MGAGIEFEAMAVYWSVLQGLVTYMYLEFLTRCLI